MTMGYGDNVLERLFKVSLFLNLFYKKQYQPYFFSKFRKVLIYDKTGLNKISFD